MKKFYLLTLAIVLFNVSFSAPVIKAISNGYWNSAATWDLNRKPQVGDTILIPSGMTVTVNDDQNLNGFVYLKIKGKLTFQNNNSTLNLGSTAIIVVDNNGQVNGGGSASQKLRLNGSAIFKGNDDPVSGPQIASAASNGFVMVTPAPLPVKFLGFTLTLKNSDVLVQWSTSEEINANMYYVERSTDGANWNTIAYVAALGNSSTVANYSFTDKNILAKVVYYRIKEVDIDGKSTVTTIKSIKSDITSLASNVVITGVNKKLLLQFPKEVKGQVTVRFVSQNGQVMDQQTINNPMGQIVLNSKLTGNYIISLSNGQDVNTAKQVVL
jgi:hypothetical protein